MLKIVVGLRPRTLAQRVADFTEATCMGYFVLLELALGRSFRALQAENHIVSHVAYERLLVKQLGHNGVRHLVVANARH